MLLRKFSQRIEPPEDPFLGFNLVQPTINAAPVLADALGYLECDLVCHMDYEGDHDIFIGRIVAGRYNEGDPFVHVYDEVLPNRLSA